MMLSSLSPLPLAAYPSSLLSVAPPSSALRVRCEGRTASRCKELEEGLGGNCKNSWRWLHLPLQDAEQSCCRWQTREMTTTQLAWAEWRRRCQRLRLLIHHHAPFSLLWRGQQRWFVGLAVRRGFFRLLRGQRGWRRTWSDLFAFAGFLARQLAIDMISRCRNRTIERCTYFFSSRHFDGTYVQYGIVRSTREERGGNDYDNDTFRRIISRSIVGKNANIIEKNNWRGFRGGADADGGSKTRS